MPKKPVEPPAPGPKIKVEKKIGRPAHPALPLSRDVVARCLVDGETPLEYMLKIMRQPADPTWTPLAQANHNAMRFEAAKAAAPYMHPRLAAVEHKGDVPLQPTLNLVLTKG